MKNYKKQDGCHNCKHVFMFDEYDSSREYYCHVDNSERPLCGSHLEDEEIDIDDDKEQEAWEKWAKPREVEPWGKCGKWEAR